MAKTSSKASTPIVNEQQIDDELQARWMAFSNKHRGHSALRSDTVYALPVELIEQIQKDVPGFFTTDDIEFETELALEAGGGFCMQQPFGYLSISQIPPTQTDSALDQRARESAEEIREMYVDALIANGIPKGKAEYALDREVVSREKLLKRREGYAGWLVTNPTFRKERDALRNAIRRTVQKDGQFPVFPQSLLGESRGVRKSRRQFFDTYVAFYRRWGLDRLQTWDLPVPMFAEADAPSFYDLNQTQNAGMTLFLPWHLLRFEDVKVSDVLQKERILSAPPCVQEWLEGKTEGSTHFALILRLYVFCELCIGQRYSKRLKNNVKRLDAAFAKHLCPATKMADKYVETIKRTRQKMRKRLADQ